MRAAAAAADDNADGLDVLVAILIAVAGLDSELEPALELVLFAAVLQPNPLLVLLDKLEPVRRWTDFDDTDEFVRESGTDEQPAALSKRLELVACVAGDDFTLLTGAIALPPLKLGASLQAATVEDELEAFRNEPRLVVVLLRLDAGLTANATTFRWTPAFTVTTEGFLTVLMPRWLLEAALPTAVGAEPAGLAVAVAATGLLLLVSLLFGPNILPPCRFVVGVGLTN